MLRSDVHDHPLLATLIRHVCHSVGHAADDTMRGIDLCLPRRWTMGFVHVVSHERRSLGVVRYVETGRVAALWCCTFVATGREAGAPGSGENVRLAYWQAGVANRTLGVAIADRKPRAVGRQT